MTSIEIKEVNPLQAWDILGSDKSAVLLDVRTRFEYEYVGHPLRAINIPWQQLPGGTIDPDFLLKVRQHLRSLSGEAGPEEWTILTLCRSGQRSRAAANRLAEDGFKRVINIDEGFEGILDKDGHRSAVNGWRYHRLPWQQG